MKKLMMTLALAMFVGSVFAQNVDLRRKIQVTGVAEREVTPDIINVSISLQEYMDGKKKVTIDQLESQLESAIKSASIAKDDFTISNVSAWNNVYQKKKNPDFLASKQYSVRFHDLNKYNAILSAVDPKGIQATNISSYDYSGVEQLKADLKKQALISARDKASSLLNAIGEKVGRPIEIIENDNSSFPGPRPVMYMAKMASAAPADSDIDATKIKLSFTIQATFEIAN